MTVIKFKPEFFKKIKDGEKTQTLRTPSHRIHVRPGDFAACIFPGLKDQLYVTITKIGYKHFVELNEDDAKREGFESVNELKKCLLEIYPTLDNASILYYYRFELDGYTEKIGD